MDDGWIETRQQLLSLNNRLGRPRYAAQLLLSLSSRSADYDRLLFESSLAECAYFEMRLDSSSATFGPLGNGDGKPLCRPMCLIV